MCGGLSQWRYIVDVCRAAFRIPLSLFSYLLGIHLNIETDTFTMTKRIRESTAFRPSGLTLPLFLRKKWNEQETAPDREINSASSNKREELPLHPQPREGEANAVFTADDLEHRIQLAAANMIEMQKQLYRGEEMYHEETNSHGNLFIRWDAFIDIRDLSASSTTQGTGSRRMPPDNRWFSGSCKSVTRSLRPNPVFVKGVTAPATPIPRSQANTPLPFPQLSSRVSSVVASIPPNDSSGIGAANVVDTPDPHLSSSAIPLSSVPIAPANTEIAISPRHDTPVPKTSVPACASPFNAPEDSPSPMDDTVPKTETVVAPIPEGPDVGAAVVSSIVKSEPASETPLRRNTRKRKVGDA
jgi:hypothetical protein